MGNGQQKKKLTQTQNGCIFLIIAGLFFGFIGIMLKTCSNNTPPSKSTKIVSGSNVIIQSPSGNPIILANTKEAYKEMHKYSIANDQMGLSGMVLSGNAFIVDSGTKALVIDRGVFEFEVRIQSGDRVGNPGWVAGDLVKLAE